MANWQGNVDVQLGTGFWIFLAVVILGVLAWRFLGKDKLVDTFSRSFSGSQSSVYARN